MDRAIKEYIRSASVPSVLKEQKLMEHDNHARFLQNNAGGVEKIAHVEHTYIYK